MKLEELKEKVREKHIRFGKLLSSPDGKEMLEMLKLNFYDHDLMAETPEKTAYNLGMREVVRFLLEMRNRAEGTPDANQRAS